MDAFDTMKAMNEFWGKGVADLLGAQQNAFSAMAPAFGTGDVAALTPDAEGFEKARSAYVESWESARAVSSAMAKGLASADGDPTTSAILAKIFDPKGWLSATGEMDEALSRLTEGPRLADLWNVERKFTAVYLAWIAVRRRNLEHNTMMLRTWTEATDAFATALRERGDAGKTLESGRDLMVLWVETANTILLETQRSDRFLSSQRETLKAATDLRLAQQAVAEYYADMFGYPTRAEIDDVHKSITELRREVRAARRRRPAPAVEVPGEAS